MTAFTHPLDRVESARIPYKPPGLLRRALRRFHKALRESRDRQALMHLSEWSAEQLRDVGLTRSDVSPAARTPLSDGRWLLEQIQHRHQL
jgi:uncharacterized protein YjiS (DUF1127 family)